MYIYGVLAVRDFVSVIHRLSKDQWTSKAGAQAMVIVLHGIFFLNLRR